MLVLMCGTTFSGKSTFARALAAEIQGLIISLDEINERRGLWGGDGIPLEEWQRTHEIATTEARTHLLGADAGLGAGAGAGGLRRGVRRRVGHGVGVGLGCEVRRRVQRGGGAGCGGAEGGC